MVAPTFLPYIGGQEVYIQSLSEALADRGHEVSVLTTDAASRAPFRRASTGLITENGVTVVRCPCYGFFYSYLPITPRLLSLLLSKQIRRYQIVHAHGFGHFTTDVVSMIRRIYGIPSVLTTHGLHQEMGQEGFHKLLLWNFYRETLVRLSLQAIDRILVLTPDEIRYLSKLGTKVVSKVQVMPVGVKPEVFSSAENLKKEGRPKLLYLGRIYRGKGIELLVEAVSQLTRYNPLLLLAGPRSDYSDSLEKLVAEKGLTDNVVLTGYVTETEKYRLLADATVFCLPSLYEGAGLAILEAMAAGIPVVATRVGGVPFLVEDGASGYLIAPSDATSLTTCLERLIREPRMRDAMGERGREIAQNYTWPKIAEKVEAIYLDLVARREKVQTANWQQKNCTARV
jgi:glycosyltransferase involved in cell wall biosynthesis